MFFLIILAILAFVGGCLTVVLYAEMADGLISLSNALDIYSVNYIYDHTKMNKPGCIVSTIMLVILTPAFWIPVIICKYFYVLFHIGRDDD